MKTGTLLGITCGVWLCVSALALAQAGKKPRSVEEIETLLRGGVSARRIIEVVEEQGVSFELTKEVRERLSKAGADESVLGAIEEAGAKKKAAQPAKSQGTPTGPATPPSPTQGEMVEVLGGEFFMGCNEKVDTECDKDEKPGRTFTVDAFKIDRTEVTVAQYGQCVDAGTCSDDGLTMPFWSDPLGDPPKEHPEWKFACNWGKTGREDHPINCVNVRQAETYCKAMGKRLPTEAEWEKAARGTDGRKYPWGNRGYGAAKLVANIADETFKRKHADSQVAEGYDDGFYTTAPVGIFPTGASPSGALDMIGNVWEWTADFYDTEHKFRSIRGGSWAISRASRARPSATGSSRSSAAGMSDFVAPSS